jgi:hypothetical protein
MGIATFNGIYQQKIKNSQTSAKVYFDKALALDEKTNGFGDKYYLFIYEGLADYWQSRNNTEKELFYRKKVKKERDD